jgi:hypothetical protein
MALSESVPCPNFLTRSPIVIVVSISCASLPSTWPKRGHRLAPSVVRTG